VEFRGKLAWLKNWRVAWIVGPLAGFLIGLLAFDEPWHQQPSYGDLATWLLVVVGAAAAWAGISQLRSIREQIAEEARRNVKRDELLDKQLAEADARALTERRRQAEEVEVSWGGQATGKVVNGSPRPVSAVTCKVLSADGRRVLAVPDKAGLLAAVPLPHGPVAYAILESEPGPQWEKLRPSERCSLTFTSLQSGDDQLLVAWFTDDAGFRWQLDEYQHLVEAADGDVYKP
jgi:hypothetical protein